MLFFIDLAAQPVKQLRPGDNEFNQGDAQAQRFGRDFGKPD
jgi:hypothetical protein